MPLKNLKKQEKTYVDILSSNYGQTDLNIHKILGRSIKFSNLISDLPESILNFSIPTTKQLSSDKLDDILWGCRQIEDCYNETQKHPDYWKPIQVANIDPFKANELLELAKTTSQFFDQADKHRQMLEEFKLSPQTTCEQLSLIKEAANNTSDTEPSKNTKFKKTDAIAQLRELSEWKAALDDFCGNEVVKSILGLHLDGIDTDFTPFEEVVSFFQWIDQVLSGESYAELRQFLKYGEAERIQNIPKIDRNHAIREIEECPASDLTSRISDAEESLCVCEANITQLRSLKNIFINSEEISRDSVTALPEQITKLAKERELLRNNTQVANILSNSFKAEETYDDDLEISLKLGLNLVNLEQISRDAVLYCIRNDLLQRLGEVIPKVIESDREAFLSLEKIVNETNSTQSDWIEGRFYKDCSIMLASANEDKEGLLAYSRFIAAKNNLQKAGYKTLVETIFAKGLINIREVVEALITRDMARESYKIHGEALASYNGNNLNLIRKRLQEEKVNIPNLPCLKMKFRRSNVILRSGV